MTKKIDWNKPLRVVSSAGGRVELLCPPKPGVHGAFVRYPSGRAKEINAFTGCPVSDTCQGVENVPEVVKVYQRLNKNPDGHYPTLCQAQKMSEMYGNWPIAEISFTDGEITAVELVKQKG